MSPITFKKKMKKLKKDFAKVVSFRITEDEKKELEKLIEPLQITKSAFFRDRFKQILLTIKK
jgi:chemotaxis methyl-accepting protein methylase